MFVTDNTYKIIDKIFYRNNYNACNLNRGNYLIQIEGDSNGQRKLSPKKAGVKNKPFKEGT